AELASAYLGYDTDYHTSRSGIRIASVSIPINLREGDSIFFRKEYSSDFAGKIGMKSLVSSEIFTIFGRDGVQAFGRKISTEKTSFYVFSVVWTESYFNDKKSLEIMLNSYVDGKIDGKTYYSIIKNAVYGADARLAQAEETLSFINSIAGEAPVIILGSLNSLHDSPELKLLKNAGFVDTVEFSGLREDYTMKNQFGTYRSDYILIRGKDLKIITTERVLDKPVYGVYPASRYGIKAVINFPEHPSAQ
ncbi:MAG: endonuclease/exonuclease/phosphatase family protein, partial [Spirochaetales bacterium]|nr:endonuclease/exonuclease/phosphatase family protein [Spirochaetales bacterium]